jgi:glucose 1-dehydrogenase
VTNAGTGENTEGSLDLPPAAFRRGLKVDLVASWVVAREAANRLVAQGGGVIVHGTSVHEEIPQPGGAAYCAAKGGLRRVTRTLALELARQRVRINNADQQRGSTTSHPARSPRR